MSTWQFSSIEKADLACLADIYCQAFDQEPWHECWTQEMALTRLTYFYKTPGFVGWKATKGDMIGGFVLGHRLPYVDRWIFDVKELCVLPSIQGQHLGSQLFEYMEKSVALPLSLYTHPQLKGYYERLGLQQDPYVMMSKKIG